jgi:hypothetical protein
VVIWSEENPHLYELDELAREATRGMAYCSSMSSEFIEEPDSDPDWDGTEFFDNRYGEDEDA